MAEYALLGKRIPKPDAVNRVTGRMVYADDMTLPGVLAGKILGSPVAHGRIRRLDVSKAARLPGVRAVVTAKDAPVSRYGGIVRDKLIFATDVVRYHANQHESHASEKGTGMTGLEALKSAQFVIGQDGRPSAVLRTA